MNRRVVNSHPAGWPLNDDYKCRERECLGLKFKLMEKNVKKYMPQKEGPKYSSTETRLIVQIEKNSKKNRRER